MTHPKLWRKHEGFNLAGDLIAAEIVRAGGSARDAELWRWFAGHVGKMKHREHADLTPAEAGQLRERFSID